MIEQEENETIYEVDDLIIDCSKTSKSLIVKLIDIKEDRALVTALFSDDCYSFEKRYADRIAKEVWATFCERYNVLNKIFIQKISDRVFELMEIVKP